LAILGLGVCKNLIKREAQRKILRKNSRQTWSSNGESIYIGAHMEQKMYLKNTYFQMHFSGQKLKDPIERYVNEIISPRVTVMAELICQRSWDGAPPEI